MNMLLNVFCYVLCFLSSEKETTDLDAKSGVPGAAHSTHY